MARILLDFDRTIHDCDHPIDGRTMGPPLPGAMEALEALCFRHEVIIFTARDRFEPVKDWLTYWTHQHPNGPFRIPILEVTNIKRPADLYIDDLALRFKGDWRITLQEVRDVLN